MMGSEIIARLGLDTAKFERGMKKSESLLKRFRKSMSGLGALAGIGGFGALAKSAIDLGSRIDDVSKKLGVSAEFLQEWGFAARETGVRTEAAEMGLQRFARRVGEAQQGLGELRGVLEQYNIQLKNTDGTSRDVNAILRDYADLIRNTADPQERLRLAFKAFDSEGAGLVTMLAKGSAGLDEWAQKAKNAGQVMSDDMVRDLAEAENAVERFSQVATVAVGKVVTKFMDLGKGIGETFAKIFFGNAEVIEVKDFMDQARKNLGVGSNARLSRDKATKQKVMDEARRLLEEEQEMMRERGERIRKIHGLVIESADEETKTAAAKIDSAKKQQGMVAELNDSIGKIKKGIAAAINKAKADIQMRDAGKRTLEEVARISGFTLGATTTAGNQGAAAREALKLEKAAEEARKIGDVAQFEKLTGQAQGIRADLFNQGALKSSEVSPDALDKAAREQAKTQTDILSQELRDANTTLKEIEKATKADRAFT